MKVNFDYNIRELGVHKTFEDFENVVFEVRMDVKIEGIAETGESHTVQFFHVMHLDMNKLNKQSFVQLDKIEKSHVVKWIEDNIDETTKANFIKKIEEMFNPPIFYYIPNFTSNDAT